MPAPITFVASGVRRESVTRGGAPAAAPEVGRLKASVALTATRAENADLRMEAVPGQDAVVVHIAGGPALWLHPEHASDLLQAQHDPARERSAVDGDFRTGEIRVPSRLQWRLEEGVPARGATRGFLGDVLVQAIDVITDLAVDKAADFVASKVVKHFDSRVDPNAGLYQLDADKLTPLKGQPAGTMSSDPGPSLVLIHGTFTETSGTFGKLWSDHPQLVRSLFTAYGGRVYGLDHPTLGLSPIANAIALAKSVPAGAQLHLLTHSRGGLVAEVLARILASPDDAFTPFRAKGYAAQRGELHELARIVSRKKLKVARLVRVGCPARGTLLASKRLDAYISVVKWALELAGIPVVPELVNFLAEVARRRADPDTLPGLAAQIPDSPLVQWLHASNSPIAGDLRVVAGDLQGDSVITWVKTLLSDAFFWTDNDLVVQTRSMYGGAPRQNNSTFLLNQGGRVSHFNYFSNTETATAIADALLRDTPDGFRVIGPLSWGGSSSSGVRAAVVPRAPAAAASLPAVFVLPGILGSNLKVGKDRIWLDRHLVNGLSRLAYDAGKKNAVEPDGPIGSFYDDLMSYLSEDHEVIPFAFDWRRPIEESANLLAGAVDAALAARKKSGKPVRMLAHSMGGLVARTMQLERPETWNRMMKVSGARILMLGTPNEGSWAPMQMLSGDDTFGNMVTVVGAPFRSHDTRQLVAQFPGLLQLQAGLLDDLGKQERWKALADEDLAAFRANSIWHRLPLQLDQFKWGIPSQQVLNRAVSLRRNLDKQRDTDLGAFTDNLLLVVGKAAVTPSGYELGSAGLAYLDVPEQGDGRVTLQSALLPGVATWTVNADHGSLPRRKEAFEAYRELLNDGKTTRLAALSAPAAARGSVSSGLIRSRHARSALDGAPPQTESEILASAARPAVSSPASGSALHVTVINGDLTYVANPLLIGHYSSSKLTGAEWTMNRAIGDAMSASLERGLYPGAAGTHQVFVNTRQNTENPWQLPRPAAVIVAGLGAEGELRGTDLVQTVRQAVIGWAQRLTERPGTPSLLTLATTLLGSGGSGISAGQAAQLIAQGVREANDQLSVERSATHRWPRVGHLQIIELYLDRAADAWRSLQALAIASPALYNLSPVVEKGIGSRPRPPDAGYRGAEYDFISALIQKGEDQEERIVYTVDSKRARSEVRAQSAQVPLIRSLISTASKNANTGPQIGRTLFRLLVPVDLEPFMGSSAATVIQLDTGTAAIPWELLDNNTPGSGDDRPWAIRTKLLRKLRTGGASLPVHDASADDSALVIGDPSCDRAVYPRLFGARQEAAAVAERLGARERAEPAGQRETVPRVTSLISPPGYEGTEPDANAIINATMAGPWRIIHIAGHGAPPLLVGSRRDPRGVVLSDNTFLGPREIGALRITPELVFVNCCYLATGDETRLLQEARFDRAEFASGVAEALIKAGVRCVVAAGWAVDDEAARVFATTFYTRLLSGATFIDAVAAAREESRACGGNTWAAYQCYGDPDWKYRRGTGDAQRPTAPDPSEELAGIASAPGLVLSLQTLAVKSEYEGADPTEQAERLRYLEQTFDKHWGDGGEVAEAFGHAWSKIGRFDEAIGWYTRARIAQDGAASLVAIEQLANLKVRRAWEQVAQTDFKNSAAVNKAREEILEAFALLDTLLAVEPTVERETLYGSAYKRLALIEAAAQRHDEEVAAISNMKAHYAAAEQIARRREEKDPSAAGTFFPAMNWIAAQLALEGGMPGVPAVDADTLAAVRRSMLAAPADFWSVVGQTELNMYTALFSGTLAENLESLMEEFKGHHDRVRAPMRWATIHDNATFVLSKYQQRATASERAAAGRLLDFIAGLAVRNQPSSESAPASRGGRAPRKRPRKGARRAGPPKRRAKR